MSERNIIGNGSTILKYFLVILATRTITLAAAHGLQLPVTATELAEIFGYILGFIIATIDAKYPNNIFNDFLEIIIHKQEDPEDIDETEQGDEGDL